MLCGQGYHLAAPAEVQYCATCRKARPPFAHHCSICNKYVSSSAFSLQARVPLSFVFGWLLFVLKRHCIWCSALLRSALLCSADELQSNDAGRCVLQHTNHCCFINNCVGLRNQAHWMRFILYALMGSSYAVRPCIRHAP